MKQFFHFCSRGFTHEILFANDTEFVAGMKVSPWGYRWSSGMLMFNEAQLAMPKEWRVSKSSDKEDSYMIWPGCYTDYDIAEKQFQSIGRFMFDLNNSNIDKEVEEELVAGSFSVPDGDVRVRAVELCLELFRKERITLCSAQERLAVARILKSEMGCNSKQLARVLHLDSKDLSKLV